MGKKERQNNEKTGDIEKIDWAEVIVALENPQMGFKDHDIKRALKKCGRQFNNNGPFRKAVSNMRLILGSSCKTRYENGDVIYSIPNVEETLKSLGYKGTEKKKTLIPVHTQEDIDRVRQELGKDKLENLELSILTIATFCKYERYMIGSKSLSEGLKDLSWKGELKLESINKILGEMTLGELTVAKSSYMLKSKEDLLDIYQRLRDKYKEISGKDYKVLDDFIVGKAAVSDKKKDAKIYPSEIKVVIKFIEVFKGEGKLSVPRDLMIKKLEESGLTKSYITAAKTFAKKVLGQLKLGKISKKKLNFELETEYKIETILNTLNGHLKGQKDLKKVGHNKNSVLQPNILGQAIATMAIMARHKGRVTSETFKSEVRTLVSASYENAAPSNTRRALGELSIPGEIVYDDNLRIYTFHGNIMEAYETLRRKYKGQTGYEYKDLSEFMKGEEKKEEQPIEESKKPSNLLEAFRSAISSTTSTLIREESDEIKWKKWLVISSIKEKVGVQQRISGVISWIKQYRRVELSEVELKRYLTEFNEDFGKGTITYVKGEYFNLDSKKLGEMSKRYNPRYIKEKVYLRIPIMSEENLIANFPGLEFTLEDKLESWGIYGVIIDRSYQAELSAKKLIRLTEVSGKIYTSDLPIIKWITKILKMEEAEETRKYHTLLGLEKI